MTPTQLLPLIRDHLRAGDIVQADDPAVGCAIVALDPSITVRAQAPTDGSADAVILLSGEVSAAEVRGPAVVDAAVRTCRPGGIIAIAVPSAIHAAATSGDINPTPSLTAAQLTHMITERGMELLLTAAPGAAAQLGARPWAGRADLDADQTPGLLDAGPVILTVARTPRTEAERSQAFFASISTKIVSASTLCLDDHGRLLIVFDSFKKAWTLPGGLIDTAESPMDAAVRETYEEGGVPVEAGDLLGVFAHDHPDRINLIYAARPTVPIPDPVAIHDHEIAEVRWVELDQGLALLAPYMAKKVRRCISDPGATSFW